LFLYELWCGSSFRVINSQTRRERTDKQTLIIAWHQPLSSLRRQAQICHRRSSTRTDFNSNWMVSAPGLIKMDSQNKQLIWDIILFWGLSIPNSLLEKNTFKRIRFARRRFGNSQAKSLADHSKNKTFKIKWLGSKGLFIRINLRIQTWSC
jgi:hypothetical protein